MLGDVFPPPPSPPFPVTFSSHSLSLSFSVQGKCEWQSDSGRMLTLRDVEMGHLSQVELFAFQRVAVNHLQAMNIPVSHALVTGTLHSCVPCMLSHVHSMLCGVESIN